MIKLRLLAYSLVTLLFIAGYLYKPTSLLYSSVNLLAGVALGSGAALGSALNTADTKGKED